MTEVNLTEEQRDLLRSGQTDLDFIRETSPVHYQAERVMGSVYNDVPIGEGAEKVVYISPFNPDLVVAFIHNSEEDEPTFNAASMKTRFYKAKLLEILLPGAVPRTILAGSQPPLVLSERIKGQRLVEGDIKDRDLAYRIYQKFEDLGFYIDYDHTNILRAESGKYVYIDTVRVVDLEKLRNAVRAVHGKQKQAEAARLLAKLEKNLAESNDDRN